MAMQSTEWKSLEKRHLNSFQSGIMNWINAMKTKIFKIINKQILKVNKHEVKEGFSHTGMRV